MAEYDAIGRTLTVTEANAIIRDTVAEFFSELTIEGEVSGFRPSSSGHWYFTLKDSQAALDAAVFRSAQYSMAAPKNGDLVIAKGSLSYYAKNGRLSFVIRSMRIKGEGSLLEMIENCRNGGTDVKFDQYPYEYGSTGLFSLLPPSFQGLSRIEQRLAVSLENEREDIKKEMIHPSGWDSIYSLVGPDKIKMLTLDSHRELEGMSLSEIGMMWNKDPLDSLLDILSDETGKAVMTDETESRENLVKIMTSSFSSFGTDSLFSSAYPHPRTKDASMHLIREYVTAEKTLTLEEAVRKMSGENADRLGLKDRGYVKEGMKADLVLFDAEKGRVDTVLVNGRAAILDGAYTGGLYGSVISRGMKNA